MTEPTVTKERLTDALHKLAFGRITIDLINEVVFPAPFEPKQGQVIAVSDKRRMKWELTWFHHKEGSLFVDDEGIYWTEARCQTPEEIGQ